MSQNISWLGMVPYICNSSYLGRGDWQDPSLRAALGKTNCKTMDKKITKAKKGLGVWLKWECACLINMRL
jgi:hypothetical protein